MHVYSRSPILIDKSLTLDDVSIDPMETLDKRGIVISGYLEKIERHNKKSTVWKDKERLFEIFG